MSPFMRGLISSTRTLVLAAVIAAAVAGIVAAPLQASARTQSQAPTPRQIAAAVTRAAHSRGLWATVSSCRTNRSGSELDIRAQMPALGFPSTLSMVIQLDYYSRAQKRFVALNSSNAVKRFTFRQPYATDLHQWGAAFVFNRGETALWEATVQFTWARGGHVIGRAGRTTTGDHHDADLAVPPHYSAARCSIG